MSIQNSTHLRDLITQVNIADRGDFEDTTREERFWMQEFRDAATSLLTLRALREAEA